MGGSRENNSHIFANLVTDLLTYHSNIVIVINAMLINSGIVPCVNIS